MENMEDKELSKKFNKVKRLLSKTDDEKTLVDGFWFNQKAIKLISYSNRNYFMNSCYNLTVADILNMILYNKNVKEVKAELCDEYSEEYAFAWYDNFKQVLESI